MLSFSGCDMLFHRTCNLATQCLRSEFSQQIRAHEFIPKITSSLADLLDHPVRRERERERDIHWFRKGVCSVAEKGEFIYSVL